MKTIFTVLTTFIVSYLGYGQLRVNDQGQIGLRVLTPSEDVEISGTMKLYGPAGYGNGTIYLDNSGYIGNVVLRPGSDLNGQVGTSSNRFLGMWTYAINGQVYTSSDERIKENIVNLSEGEENPIYHLRPVSYDYKVDYYGDLQNREGTKELVEQMRLGHFGFLAQEVEQVIPELVNTTDKDLYSLNYVEMIPFLVSAVQEQRSQIEELTEAIERLTQGASELGLENVDDKQKNEVLTLAPNPTSDYSMIRIRLDEFSGVTVMVTKLDGELVKEFVVSSNDQSFKLDSSLLFSKGIYLITAVKGNEIIQSEKLLYR